MHRKARWVLIAAGLIFGAIPLIIGFLTGWWVSYVEAAPINDVIIWALVGLALGGLIDGLFLKMWLKNLFIRPLILWGAVYLFYSVGCFGFFMGMPVFNVLLALPAGLLVGARLAYLKRTNQEVQSTVTLTARFTTAVLAIASLASATLALVDPYTAANLQGMFGLSFTVTQPMIIALILVGGTLLLVVNWWLTKFVVQWTYRWLHHPTGQAGVQSSGEETNRDII